MQPDYINFDVEPTLRKYVQFAKFAVPNLMETAILNYVELVIRHTDLELP